MGFCRLTVCVVVFVLVAGLPIKADHAFARETEKAWAAKITSLQGKVMARRQGQSHWKPVQLNDALYAGDRVRVGGNSRAALLLSNDTTVRLDQNTTMVVSHIEKKTTFIIKMLRGAANFFSRRPRSLKIFTPFANGVVEGTEFYVGVDEEQTHFDLFEGRILAENRYGSLHLVKGQGAVASANSAPRRRILAQPRDSVQWALYYPSILALGHQEVPKPFNTAIALLNKGRTHEALAELEKVEEGDRNAGFFALRAGLLLHLGRVSRANTQILKSLDLEPDNSRALSLQSIIAVVQNRKKEALESAQKAVELNAQSPSALVALSYAHQAEFNLPQALEAARTATLNAPKNGMAWARLAELQLSTGDLDRGIRSAQKAVSLNPDTAHAHTILGFAYLTQMKTEKAGQTFTKAISLDSAAPLPRLGLGLAQIRKGALEQGRSQIEIAVGLDPLNALIRSYLGKAYFDEKRGPLDERQLEIAKTLDPNDPTPYYYDAIRKQSLNRPVEALRDLQKSIKLNDNRAVYRSRLLLDQDLAARSAGLGRIYNDLGFQELALQQGYKSLSADTTNYSAHRLLADTYAAKPRHEIARVSELLQAQLFAPLNLTPIQPHLAESETSFLQGAGPADLSLNEFGPLFTRNRIAFQGANLIGSSGTWGNEVTGSGVLDRVSVSIADFNYRTDGIRENNDLEQDILNYFVQASLTAKTSLQAEYRKSEIDKGDRTQNFDGVFSTTKCEKESVKQYRVGGRHVFSPKFEAIASYIRTDTEIDTDDLLSGMSGSINNQRLKREGYLFEARGDYKTKRFSLTAGMGRLQEDSNIVRTARLGPPLFFPVYVPDTKYDITKHTFYAYSLYRPVQSIEFTLGLSLVSFERKQELDTDEYNPKFGLVWHLDEQTTIRMAVFKTLNSTNVAAQTIEPTQVAGLNQLYDDADGSKVLNFGGSISHDFSHRFSGGIEFVKRYLDVPVYRNAPNPAVFHSWEEYIGSAYIHWTPNDLFAFSTQYQYERFDREENAAGLGISDVSTHKFPISIKLFHPMGLSWGMKATYYFQDGYLEETNSSNIFSGGDTFWIVDAEVSYRLPKRYGILSFGVKNMFEEEFSYQDIDPSNPMISPKCLVYGKIVVSF